MSGNPSLFEISVHLEDSRIVKYIQSDWEISKTILDRIQLNKLFAQHHLLIGDRDSITAIACSRIVCIKFSFPEEDFPEWPFLLNATEILQITEPEFLTNHVLPQPLAMFHGEIVTAYCSLEMSSGELIFLRLRIPFRERPPQDQGTEISQMFHAPVIYARGISGGVILVNSAHIVKMSFFPPSPPVLGQWQAAAR